MFDDWGDLEVDEDDEEEEPPPPRLHGKETGGGLESRRETSAMAPPAERGDGDDAILEEIVPLRDFETVCEDAEDQRAQVEATPRRGDRAQPPQSMTPERHSHAIGDVWQLEEAAAADNGDHHSGAEQDGGAFLETSSSPSSILPGPIGQLQRAWSRRSRGEGPLQAMPGGRRDGPPASAAAESELLRSFEDEEDFKTRPWLRALGALDIGNWPDAAAAGLVSNIGTLCESPSSKFPNRKVGRLVGLVKHHEIGGDGDAYVVLKDPTGSIGGTVHGEVARLRSREAPPIGKGSVLVLERVSLFSPDERTQFLCITTDNVLQVFAN